MSFITLHKRHGSNFFRSHLGLTLSVSSPWLQGKLGSSRNLGKKSISSLSSIEEHRPCLFFLPELPEQIEFCEINFIFMILQPKSDHNILWNLQVESTGPCHLHWRHRPGAESSLAHGQENQIESEKRQTFLTLLQSLLVPVDPGTCSQRQGQAGSQGQAEATPRLTHHVHQDPGQPLHLRSWPRIRVQTQSHALWRHLQ